MSAGIQTRSDNEHQRELPMGLWRLGEALRHGWLWAVVAGGSLAVLGFAVGYRNGPFTAVVKLVRSELPALVNPGDGTNELPLRPVPVEELVSLGQSPSVARHAAERAGLPLTPEQVAASCAVTRLTNGGLIQILVRRKDPAQTVALANGYAEEVARIAQEIQSKEVSEASALLNDQLSTLDQELERTSQDLVAVLQKSSLVDFEKEPTIVLQQWTELNRKCEVLRSQIDTLDLQISSLLQELSRYMPALVMAREALDRALLRYTEEHPKVKELRATIAALESRIAERGVPAELDIAAWDNPVAVGLYNQVVDLRRQRIVAQRQAEEANRRREKLEREIDSLPATQLAYGQIKSRFQSLRENRELLAGRLQRLRLVADKSVGFHRVVEPASLEDLGRSGKWREGLAGGVVGGTAGTLVVILFLWWLESAHGRIRSSAALRRVTGLPVLASLGDLSGMSEAERQQWAFRTLTSLKGTLVPSGNAALVCGFISATHGEGRSTCIRLLADAANRIGCRTLTVSAEMPGLGQEPAREGGLSQVGGQSPLALPLPADLLRPVPAPSMSPPQYLSLPARGWTPERRAKWTDALREWNGIENLVVFVELPPAYNAESILLAESVPNVIWLCGQDMAKVSETRSHLETLRHGRSHVVGGVFNRGMAGFAKRGLANSIGLSITVLVLSLAPLGAQEPAPLPASPTAPQETASPSISAFSPDRLAGWQKRLTLGPGDTLDISIYEAPDSLRAGLSIGPDGRINYLEARDVAAAGLTVDELRMKLEEILAKYRRAPRIVIQPTAYNSKRYYILGNVNQKGVFPLDRPVSVIEAVAHARGFVSEVPAGQRNPLVQADLPRSFLVRRGADRRFHRVAVDFEGLFLRGDLSQNLPLEPDDYLFFPALDLQEVYVVGAVRAPGVVPFTKDLTALGAIVARAGFTDDAWRQKVLVVRGSLNRPQTFVVNAAGILSAKGPDFQLNNRDIVYVHKKPWAKAQELVEFAILSFARGFVTAYTTANVGPWIKEPLLE